MGNPYAFGRKSLETAQLQSALLRLNFDLGPNGADGIYGTATRDAVTAVQHQLGIVATGKPDKAVLVFLGLIEARPPSIFDQIGAIASILNLLKGKTMTSDQIAGLVRTILASLLAYVAGKGWIPNASPELIAALTTVVVSVWSWVSNRPKTITKIGN